MRLRRNSLLSPQFAQQPKGRRWRAIRTRDTCASASSPPSARMLHGLLHRLQLVDHGLDDVEAFLPERAARGVEAEGLQELGVVLGAAGFQHREVFRDEARMGVPVEAI